nr:lysophospholipid acyltransferase family protein [Ardenticatena sp.]
MRRVVHWRRWLAKWLIGLVARTLVEFEIRGRREIPPGPLLIACNHIGDADPPALLHAMPEPIEYVAAADLWSRPFLPPLLSFYAPIRVRRDGGLTLATIRRVMAALERGERVAIFPEGGISDNARLREAREGVGYLALKANVPILPVAMWGTERLFDDWRHGRRGHIVVHIGEPFSLPPLNTTRRREQRAEATQRIMCEIARLLPPEYRGVYANCVSEGE